MGFGILHWAGFIALLIALVLLDLFFLQRQDSRPTLRQALLATALWVSLALLFGAWLYLRVGAAAAAQYGAGYLLELSLSVDNLFVFIIIFRTYGVPERFLHKALLWGVLGALVLRLLFVALGSALVARFAWTLQLFGAFLLYTGFKLLLKKGETPAGPGAHPAGRWLGRFLPLSKDWDPAGRFLVRRRGRWLATPLLLVVIVIEASDVLFAVDSIPAVFGVTREPFIVFTSNMFAVLGLRSLFFALEGLLHLFRFLPLGLSLVLMLIGAKLLVLPPLEHYFGLQAQPWEHATLGLVGLVLAASVALSLLFPGPAGARRKRSP